MYFDGTEQAMEEYRRHLLNSVLYYPETTTMTVRDLSYTDVLRWVHEYGFTGDGALSVARDLTAHLLGIPKDER
jgi:hypothetical protein